MNWRQAGLLGWLFAYTFILYLVDMIPPEPWKSHIIIFMVQNILGIEAWPLVRATTRAGQDPLASQRLRIHRRLVEGIILLGASIFIYRLSWFGTRYISMREKGYPVVLILTILYDTIWYAIARSMMRTDIAEAEEWERIRRVRVIREEKERIGTRGEKEDIGVKVAQEA